MSGLSLRKMLVIVLFAFIGWAACGATMGVGMALSSIDTTLVIHAIGAPIYFIILSLIYFKKFNYTKPIATAALFISFVIIVDFFLIALVINKSLDMFRSFLGIWLPFILIFISTWMTGKLVTRQSSGS